MHCCLTMIIIIKKDRDSVITTLASAVRSQGTGPGLGGGRGVGGNCRTPPLKALQKDIPFFVTPFFL